MSERAEQELEIRHLTVSFRAGKNMVHAVRDVSLTVGRGETLAIVGESGSGKSVSAKAVLGIEAPNAVIEGGEILYGGDDLLKYSEKQFERIRGNRISMIFQDPMSSLDPIMKIGRQLTEAMILNGRTEQRLARKEAKQLQADLLSALKQAGMDGAEIRAGLRAYVAARGGGEHAAAGQDGFIAAVARAGAQDTLGRLEAALTAAGKRVTAKAARERALELLREVGIRDPEKRFDQYPFEFSGGMRQRIVIAIAIAANPDLLICDEPTTALDVTIQAQILELINRLKKSRGMSVIFITHDLGVVANVADRVAVMYAGKVVEVGTVRDIFYRPAHPYTWALLASMPDLDTGERLVSIPGIPPDMRYPPQGDAFALRSAYAMQIDFEKEPPLFRISESHYAATWLLHPSAPHVELPKAVTERIRRMREREEAGNE